MDVPGLTTTYMRDAGGEGRGLFQTFTVFQIAERRGGGVLTTPAGKNSILEIMTIAQPLINLAIATPSLDWRKTGRLKAARVVIVKSAMVIFSLLG